MKPHAQEMTCKDAIVVLMLDGRARTSVMIAALTGFSHGRVRSEMSANMVYATDRRKGDTGWPVTWYQLEGMTSGV